MLEKSARLYLENCLNDLINRNIRVKFLLIGRTGVGKSSTINSFFGKNVTPVGKYEPTTMGVKTYSHVHEGLHCDIVDTPGLCDDLPESGNDENYIRKMFAPAKSADCVWFVTELDATRVTSDEKRGIKLITQYFGNEIWDRSVIVFTKADKVDQKNYEEAFSQRSKLIKLEIEKNSPGHGSGIPCVAVSNSSQYLPNGQDWLSELFTHSILRFSEEGFFPFLKSMSKEVSNSTKDQVKKKPRIQLNNNQKSSIKSSFTKKILQNASLGAGLGAKIGSHFGPLGTAIGTALGAVCGGIFSWLFED